MSNVNQLDLFTEHHAKSPKWSATSRDAVLSPCGMYRYSLSRVWDSSLARVCFVMLNPSTADASNDDPTIRRCMAFAKTWGYGAVDVVNLFAWRATEPKELVKASQEGKDIIGCPGNDNYIEFVTSCSELVIAAWGNHGLFRDRGLAVTSLIKAARKPVLCGCSQIKGTHNINKHSPFPVTEEIHCLGITRQKQPRHPLYVAGYFTPIPYSPVDSELGL